MVNLRKLKGSDGTKPPVAATDAFSNQGTREGPIAAPKPPSATVAEKPSAAVTPSLVEAVNDSSLEFIPDAGSASSGSNTTPDASLGSEPGTVRETPVPIVTSRVQDDVVTRLGARLRTPEASPPAPNSTGFAETVAVGTAVSPAPVKPVVKQSIPAPVAVNPKVVTSSGSAKKPERKWQNRALTIASITALVVGAILIIKDCGHKRVVPPAPQPVCADPTPKTCSEKTGQPFGMFFDEKNCGYCGKTGPNGFIKEPWMTPDNCPVVFSCGNHKVDKKEVYPIFTKDKDGTFYMDLTEVTESCNPKAPNYCQDDCPKPNPKHGKSTAVKPARETALDCSTVDAPRAQEAVGPIRNNIVDARGAIDTAFPKFVGQQIKVDYRVRIDSTGELSLLSASVQGDNVKNMVDLGSVRVTSGKNDCVLTHTATIPASK